MPEDKNDVCTADKVDRLILLGFRLSGFPRLNSALTATLADGLSDAQIEALYLMLAAFPGVPRPPTRGNPELEPVSEMEDARR